MENMQPIYLVCGVSGAGKSWVCRQLTDKFHYIPHDRCWIHPTKKSWDPATMIWAADMRDDSNYLSGAKSTHLEVLIKAVGVAQKPVLTECPFAERVLREDLERAGCKVIPFFVIEDPAIVKCRYETREKKDIPKSALTRASSIRSRALEWNAPFGTSDELLRILKSTHI